MSERELFDEWAKSNIENHCDAVFNGKYYVIRENSRLTKEKKNFLILSLNVGLKAWQASANRKGYKLVPVEPTEEMIDAGVEESDVDWKRLKFAYQAMIEAVG